MKIVSIVTLFIAFIFGFSLISNISASPPTIARPMEIIEATIEGGNPQTIDPAACYDTASGELLMNMYDTLIFFNGEHMGQYIPQLASSWTIENITGLGLKNGDLDLYYRYTFKMNSSAKFWDGSTVTAADVEYCVEREMYMDFSGGPQWMFFEPLLNNWGILGLNTTPLEGNATEQARVGALVDNTVESNATHVWFNLAFPGAYAPFMVILSQVWASVYSKAWAIGLGRATNWDGVYANWFASWNPATPPFDTPTPVAMGSGPFVFETWDATLMQWSLLRNHAYFRGWPLDWPAFRDSKPAGYIEHYVVSWAWNWTTRSAKFLAGEVDYCAVPRQNMSEVLNQPGIRCTYPLPSLAVDALFYNFDINPSSPYGPIFDYGVFGEDGIPRDFFSDINVRKAFSHCIDFVTFITTVYQGEAMQPATAIIPGLPYYDASIPKYDYNLALATTLFQAAFGGNLWTTGFTIQLIWNQGNLARQTVTGLLAAALNSLNPKFNASSTPAPWASYMYARTHRQLSLFTSGWLADYPDAHNFAYGFYYSDGYYAWTQGYSSASMDALIEQGIATPDGPARNLIYKQIQQLVIDDCPSVALEQYFGRHFERDWVVGWYYNPNYCGNYAANVWKWYYTPQAQLSDYAIAPTCNYLSYDVNYDGKVNGRDIGACAKSFGAVFGPPMSPTWVYRCDLNNDRKIDIKDIAKVAQNYGKTSPVWVPTP
jgi:peptide/nickel transport system substrate-binding protein